MLNRGWWGRASSKSRLAAALFWWPLAALVFVWTVLDFVHGSADYFDLIGIGPGAFFVVLFFPAQIVRALRDVRTGGGVEPMPPLSPRR